LILAFVKFSSTPEKDGKSGQFLFPLELVAWKTKGRGSLQGLRVTRLGTPGGGVELKMS
jgi:hypothetical protein